MNLNEFIQNGLAGKSENTKKTYSKALRQFEAWLEFAGGSLSDLTRTDVQTYMDYLAAHKKSAATIKKSLAAISAYCNCTSQDACKDVRIRVEAPLPNAPKALTRDEELACLRQLEREGNLRNMAIFLLLLETGLRVSELCALDLEDVTIERYKNGWRGEVVVRHGKGFKQRVVPIPHRACAAVLEWKDVRPEVEGETALFLSTHRRRITARQVERVMKRLGTHPHALRHTYCTRLVQSGEVDIVTVAELAGHADINTTRKYAKPSQERLHEVVEGVF